MRRLAGVCAVLALATAGCGGTTSSELGTGASNLVPSSAAVFIAIDSDPQSEQWQTVDRLADKFPDKQKGVDSIKKEMRGDGVDWDKDIKPALGPEFDVVWLDFERDGDNFILLTQPKNEAKFEQLVAKSNTSEKNPSDKLVYEKFRGWYVLSEKQAVIERFKRESESAAKTLSQESDFTRSMDRLGEDSVVRAYISGKAVVDAARKYGGSDVRPYIDKAGTLDWIALRLGAESNGVALDSIVHGTPGDLFKGLKMGSSFKADLPKSVPRNALLYWTFHGSKGMFTNLQNNSLFKSADFRQFRDVFADLDTLLQGENAFYLRPGKRIPEVTFVASPGKGEDGALIVDRLLERELQFVPEHQMIDGVNARKVASEGIGVYWGNVNGRLVVTDMPRGIRDFKKSGKSLTDNGAYQEAADASGLPDNTVGFLFVDIKSSIPFGEKLAEQRIPADISRNLKPLRSAVQYAISRTHEVQVTFFLLIK